MDTQPGRCLSRISISGSVIRSTLWFGLHGREKAGWAERINVVVVRRDMEARMVADFAKIIALVSLLAAASSEAALSAEGVVFGDHPTLQMRWQF